MSTDLLHVMDDATQRRRKWPAVRDRNDILSELLQSHGSCGDLYFESPIAGTNLESLAGFDVECLAKRFGDDDSPGRVDGSFHGKNYGMKMAAQQPMS